MQTLATRVVPVLLILALSVNEIVAVGSSNCLYCERSDFTATLLTSYSYCPTTDQCLQDQWNYINRPCSAGWTKGQSLDAISSCGATAATCHSFVSTAQAAGSFFNYTETLALGQYCLINVDASQFVARLALDDATTVGLQYSKYLIGRQVVINNGDSKQFIAYNGDTSGTITFTLSFASGSFLTSSLAVVAVLCSLMFYS